MVVNLNRVIDRNAYPVPQARVSNLRHRPIGIGVQGLAGVFLMLRMPYDSERARDLNKQIFETIYYAALSASVDLAEQEGPHDSFAGSPASEGTLQFDMWGSEAVWAVRVGGTALARAKGLRNSLLVAPMPTASTAQILGNNECFEPYTSSVYTRRVLAGDFAVVNKHLLADLVRLGLWDATMRERILRADGSIQGIEAIPEETRLLYRTAWELEANEH